MTLQRAELNRNSSETLEVEAVVVVVVAVARLHLALFVRNPPWRDSAS